MAVICKAGGKITLQIKEIMKTIIPYLIKAEAKHGYKLFVEFEDGVNGIIDLSKAYLRRLNL